MRQQALLNQNESRSRPVSGPRDMLSPKSQEYAWRTIEVLRLHWATVRDDERRIRLTLEEIEQSRLYELWPTKQPYGSIDALCRAELGVPEAEVRRTIAASAAERSRLAAERTTGDVLPEGRPPEDKLGNFPSLSQGERAADVGLSDRTQRKLDRLARDFPDYHQAVCEGRLSVDRAYREARGLPRMVSVPLTVDGAAEALRRHFSPDDLASLIELLEGGQAEA